MTRAKYGATPCEWQGNRYRSKREMARHQELLLLERAGHITGLGREVQFELAPGVKFHSTRWTPALRYVADFVYRDQNGREIVEDCKGFRTPVYRIKRHLMMTVHGIEVVET